MSCVNTLFHELLHLIKATLPDDIRETFYTELLDIIGRHGIRLNFLVGEDDKFDNAFKKFKDEQ